MITSGHGRLEAARLLKLKEVPVNFQDYDSEEQEYADVQSDNAIASWSDLDIPGIAQDLHDLGPDFDLDMLGLKHFELDLTPTKKEEPETKKPNEVSCPNCGEVFKASEHKNGQT
jgi:hypothetical protein